MKQLNYRFGESLPKDLKPSMLLLQCKRYVR